MLLQNRRLGPVCSQGQRARVLSQRSGEARDSDLGGSLKVAVPSASRKVLTEHWETVKGVFSRTFVPALLLTEKSCPLQKTGQVNYNAIMQRHAVQQLHHGLKVQMLAEVRKGDHWTVEMV